MPVPGQEEPEGNFERIYLSDDSDVYDKVADSFSKMDHRFGALYSSANLDVVQAGDVWYKAIYDTAYTEEIEELREELAIITGKEFIPRPTSASERQAADEVLYGDNFDNDTAVAFVQEMDRLIYEACSQISTELGLGKLAILEVIEATEDEIENLEYETSYAVHIFARIEAILKEAIAEIKAQEENAFRSDAHNYGHDTAVALAEDRTRSRVQKQ